MKKIVTLFFLLAALTFITNNSLLAKGVDVEENYVPDPAITAMIASNPQIIEEKLRAAMLSEVEDPASLTIEIIHSSPEDTALGRFKKIHVLAYGSKTKDVTVHSAQIDFIDVHLNTKVLIEANKIRPVNKCTINLDIIVKENDLNAFLKRKAKKIKVDNPKVKLGNNNIELFGSTKYGFIKVEFWARGNFSIKNDKEIWFYSNKMKVNRVSMPRNFVGTIIKKINPLLCFDKFSFNVNLEAIRINEGEIRITSFPN